MPDLIKDVSLSNQLLKNHPNPKYRDAIFESLCQISRRVNPEDVAIRQDALIYVAECLLDLLARILEQKPHNPSDVELFVGATFPPMLRRSAVNHARQVLAVTAGGKAAKRLANAANIKLYLPAQKIQNALKEIMNCRVEILVLNYALAILEYIAGDMFQVTGKYVKNMKHNEILIQDLKVALYADSDLTDLLFRDEESLILNSSPKFFTSSFTPGFYANGSNWPTENHTLKLESFSTYQQLAKEFLYDENQFLRHVNMICLVFRHALENLGKNRTKTGADFAVYDNNLTIDSETNQNSLGTFSSNHSNVVNKSLVDLEKVFSNILEIKEVTVKFLDKLEAAMEIADENSQPHLGECFVEMIEGTEFNSYLTYIDNVLNVESLDYFYSLFDVTSSIYKYLKAFQNGFNLSVRYVLPQLLLVPIFHCSSYFDYLSALQKLTKSQEDLSNLTIAEGSMLFLKKRIESYSGELMRRNPGGRVQLRFVPCGQSQLTLSKIEELSRQIEGLDSKVESKNFGEFIREGSLGLCHGLPQKLGNTLLTATDTLRSKSSRQTERYAFLFDSVIVLCKPLPVSQQKWSQLPRNDSTSNSITPNSAGSSTPHFSPHFFSNSCGSSATEFFNYKCKECLQIRRLEVVDRDDTDDLKFAFEVRTKRVKSQDGGSNETSGSFHASVLLFAKTFEEKQAWMASLVLLQTRSMLERMLDVSLTDEANRIPLIKPSVEQYRFAEKNSDDNVVFEDYLSSNGLQIIRGATLLKFIEVLTPSEHPDPNMCKMFLMMYRSFCDPHELLKLLIERFYIPDPSPYDEITDHLDTGDCMYTSTLGDLLPEFHQNYDYHSDQNSSPVTDGDPTIRDILKKFRTRYVQPIQIRVMNAIRHWVDDHWYDFSQDSELCAKLNKFLIDLDKPKYKHVHKWARNVRVILCRKERSAHIGDSQMKDILFVSDPPHIEWHLTRDPSSFNILTLHPVEIARQVTLLEFELYRAVKPFELVDAPFTRKDKMKRSLQLTKLVKHSTSFTYWLEMCVVEKGNFEERVAVMNRILEIMCVFEELNNFNGLMEINGALLSAAVARLKNTWKGLDKSLLKRWDQVKCLFSDPRHYSVRRKLKTVNPPCVPYFGTYLTNLTYLNEKKTFLENHSLHHHNQPGNHQQQQQQDNRDTVSLVTVMTEDALSSVNLIDNNPQLINVAKCRKIFDIILEIQLYQDQPYCLNAEPKIRNFFESLNPLQKFNDSSHDLETYLYESSLKVEPKTGRMPDFEPTLELSSLKSPGIKLSKISKSKTSFTSHTIPSTSFFTPLQKSKDKSSTLGVASSISNANSATSQTFIPPSPTLSKDAHFSVIDIEPGKPPRYISDVHRPDTIAATRRCTTSRQTSNSNNQQQLQQAPPLPPKPATSSTSSPLSSSQTPPPLPPRATSSASSAATARRSSQAACSVDSSSKEFDQTCNSRFNFPEISIHHHHHHHHHQQQQQSQSQSQSSISPAINGASTSIGSSPLWTPTVSTVITPPMTVADHLSSFTITTEAPPPLPPRQTIRRKVSNQSMTAAPTVCTPSSVWPSVTPPPVSLSLVPSPVLLSLAPPPVSLSLTAAPSVLSSLASPDVSSSSSIPSPHAGVVDRSSPSSQLTPPVISMYDNNLSMCLDENWTDGHHNRSAPPLPPRRSTNKQKQQHQLSSSSLPPPRPPKPLNRTR